MAVSKQYFSPETCHDAQTLGLYHFLTWNFHIILRLKQGESNHSNDNKGEVIASVLVFFLKIHKDKKINVDRDVEFIDNESLIIMVCKQGRLESTQYCGVLILFSKHYKNGSLIRKKIFIIVVFLIEIIFNSITYVQTSWLFVKRSYIG